MPAAALPAPLARLLCLALALLGAACSGLPGDPNARVCLEGWDERPEETEALLDAAAEWRERTQGGANLRLYSDAGGCESADVVLRAWHWSDSTRGETDPSGEWIQIEPDGAPARVLATALHECGHYLTGPEHSPHAEDVMSYAHTSRTSKHLTPRDAARFER